MTAAGENTNGSNYKRAHNFSPGPGMLPTAVMERAQREFMNFRGMEMGVMEVTNLDASGPTHQGKAAHPLQQMMLDTEAKLRTVLSIPPTYRVLFMHGGAVGQFSAVPLNLAAGGTSGKADYVKMGFWTCRATKEAEKYVDVSVPATFEEKIAPVSEWRQNIRPDAAYVHICLNETVQGLEYNQDPEWSDDDLPPLVADATSTLLSRHVDVSRYGLIYASGGKNLPAGLTTIIVRESLLREREAHPLCPQIMDYRLNGGGLAPLSSVFESAPNTPPTWGVYMLGLILDDMLEAKGGLEQWSTKVQERADRVYSAIDNSGGFYVNKVDPSSRSRINMVANLPTRELEKMFVQEAEAQGLFALFGHPVNGGIRITLYNGVPDESIDVLLEFMSNFQPKYQDN